MAKFSLPELPFAINALEPHISENTLNFHYGKHHQTYVNTLNSLIEGTKYEKLSLEEIIKNSEGGIFNNAAQVYNHTFFWNCLTPNHQKEPTGRLRQAIEDSFGSFDNFKAEFTQKSVGLFGSGWCWLVKDNENKLQIIQKQNAGCPLTDGLIPLLVCDVWEHAYYLDKQNARPKYLESFWELVDWKKVETRF
ncbi:MAG: superoxide dismutase [Bacteroidales bacterium]|nr:superoxide dismutase [Bacteroidales bacterium]